ncbi:MAG: hypothetical protein AAGK05_15935 [Pseudomonadota bacterium]
MLLLLLFSSEQLRALEAADNDKIDFHKREEALLKKIFRDYDPAKASSDFKKNNGKVFYDLYPPTFSDFSELHLSGEAYWDNQIIWRDYAIKSWSPEEVNGRRMVHLAKPKNLWRPPAPIETLESYNEKDGYIFIRNDSYVFFSKKMRIKVLCHMINRIKIKNKEVKVKNHYPNEMIACTPRTRIQNFSEMWDYSCKKSFYNFFHESNVSVINYENCSQKSYQQILEWRKKYYWTQVLKGWRIRYMDDSRGLLVFVRLYSYNYIVDVLSCTAMAFLTVTQFFVPALPLGSSTNRCIRLASIR